MRKFEEQVKEFEETVVEIKRVSKKTKGGNTMRFSALVVVGDRKGRVGVALTKASDVRSAIMKSIEKAKREMVDITIKGNTIPSSIALKYSAAKIILKPAPPGSGIIAGGPVRVVLENAGVKDAVGKILGTNNKTTNVYAAVEALKKISKIDSRKRSMSRKASAPASKTSKSTKTTKDKSKVKGKK